MIDREIDDTLVIISDYYYMYLSKKHHTIQKFYKIINNKVF